MAVRAQVVVRGIVQGVGFRPFVYRLAREHGLGGWVLNSTQGVVIEVEGESERIEGFLGQLQAEPPPQAVIEKVETSLLPPVGYSSFVIEASREGSEFVLISPDICICADCLRELRDPHDPRYRYPFINCTNCGPRFTIISDIPYDRPKTTMRVFAMCPRCDREYHDPADRRFHAQPNACPVCGPRVALAVNGAAAAADPRRAHRDRPPPAGRGGHRVREGPGGLPPGLRRHQPPGGGHPAPAQAPRGQALRRHVAGRGDRPPLLRGAGGRGPAPGVAGAAHRALAAAGGLPHRAGGGAREQPHRRDAALHAPALPAPGRRRRIEPAAAAGPGHDQRQHERGAHRHRQPGGPPAPVRSWPTTSSCTTATSTSAATTR